MVDIYIKKTPKKIVKFDIEKFNNLSGLNLKVSEAMSFLKQKTAYEIRIRDWSSDVCSSDLFPSHDTAHVGGSASWR